MDRHLFRNKKILITGANGFIGRHLVRIFLKQKARVFIIDMISMDVNKSGCTTYRGNIEDKDFINGCIDQCSPDIVFHLAAFKERSSDIADFYKAIAINVLGSLNLFYALKRSGSVSSIVVLGTAEEYGRNKSPFTEEMRGKPVTAYSFSKLCMTNLSEMLYNLYQLPIVVLRPTLAYGPGQSTEMFLPSLIVSLLQNKPFPMTAGMQKRDFIYIDDLVDAMIRAALYPSVAGKVINIGSGKPVTLSTITGLVEAKIGKQGLIQQGIRDYRPLEIMEYAVDISRARELLGFSPKISFEEGLEKTIQYYMKVM